MTTTSAADDDRKPHGSRAESQATENGGGSRPAPPLLPPAPSPAAFTSTATTTHLRDGQHTSSSSHENQRDNHRLFAPYIHTDARAQDEEDHVFCLTGEGQRYHSSSSSNDTGSTHRRMRDDPNTHMSDDTNETLQDAMQTISSNRAMLSHTPATAATPADAASGDAGKAAKAPVNAAMAIVVDSDDDAEGFGDEPHPLGENYHPLHHFASTTTSAANSASNATTPLENHTPMPSQSTAAEAEQYEMDMLSMRQSVIAQVGRHLSEAHAEETERKRRLAQSATRLRMAPEQNDHAAAAAEAAAAANPIFDRIDDTLEMQFTSEESKGRFEQFLEKQGDALDALRRVREDLLSKTRVAKTELKGRPFAGSENVEEGAPLEAFNRTVEDRFSSLITELTPALEQVERCAAPRGDDRRSMHTRSSGTNGAHQVLLAKLPQTAPKGNSSKCGGVNPVSVQGMPLPIAVDGDNDNGVNIAVPTSVIRHIGGFLTDNERHMASRVAADWNRALCPEETSATRMMFLNGPKVEGVFSPAHSLLSGVGKQEGDNAFLSLLDSTPLPTIEDLCAL